MNFDLTDDQRRSSRTAREFLAARYPLAEVRRLALDDERGWTDQHWDEIVELGWPDIAELGTVELAVVAEELGYALRADAAGSRRGRPGCSAPDLDGRPWTRWLRRTASPPTRGTADVLVDWDGAVVTRRDRSSPPVRSTRRGAGSASRVGERSGGGSDRRARPRARRP